MAVDSLGSLGYQDCYLCDKPVYQLGSELLSPPTVFDVNKAPTLEDHQIYILPKGPDALVISENKQLVTFLHMTTVRKHDPMDSQAYIPERVAVSTS